MSGHEGSAGLRSFSDARKPLIVNKKEELNEVDEVETIINLSALFNSKRKGTTFNGT
jgi:hypothetical protein